MDNEDLVKTTESYYDSEDADNFYFTIWGGEDIHVGLYEEGDTIYEASIKTVKRMADKLNIDTNTRIIDIGAGYGGSARYLANRYGCHVECINISEKENERNRQKNKEQGLDHLINVQHGNFEDIPFDDSTFDVVWCQDSILHSGRKKKVFEESYRILKQGGDFIFSDPMQKHDAPQDVLQPVLNRIHLDHMGSVTMYREFAEELGLEEVEIEEIPHQLPNHYGRVLEEVKKNEDQLQGKVSNEYIEKMKQGLEHWVDKGNRGYLNWGIVHFRKK
jgi:sarcosine/dimethylglycine N-methyltransferase